MWLIFYLSVPFRAADSTAKGGEVVNFRTATKMVKFTESPKLLSRAKLRPGEGACDVLALLKRGAVLWLRERTLRPDPGLLSY